MNKVEHVDPVVVEAVGAFLAAEAAVILREQRSPWISPRELAVRFSSSPSARSMQRAGPNCDGVEAALRALSTPCVKVAGSRCYLLVPRFAPNHCIVHGNLQPTKIATNLRASIGAITE